MGKAAFLAQTILGILLLACPISRAFAQEIAWRSDYAAARQEAQQKQRPLLLDFGTTNCFWCKRLDAVTFRDPTVSKLVREHFVAVKIDAEKDAELARLLRIESYPTLVFAAPDGKILGQHAGFMEPAPFMHQLQTVLASTPPPRQVDPSRKQVREALAALASQAKSDPAQLAAVCDELAATLAELHLELAECLLRRGQSQQAIVCLQRAVQAAPQSQPAQMAQARLLQLQKPAGPPP
jgi:thioredoxin-related protein